MPALPRYHRHARADLQALWRYLAQRNPKAAGRYLDELQQRASTHAANPNLGGLEPGLTQRLKLPSDMTLRSFLYRNHRAYYIPIDDGIFILRVLATRQDRDTAFDG